MTKTIIKITTLLFLIFSLAVPLHAGEEKGTLAYSRLTDGFWQIWVMDLSTNTSQQFTFSNTDKRSPIWIEGGQRLMFRTNNAEMFTIDLKNKKETRILKKFGVITDPAWSEASGELAFTRYEGNLKDESQVWAIKLNGEGQRVLTNQQGLQRNPTWSPDGEKIAYASGSGFGAHEIWVMDKDGKNPKKLTQNTNTYDILPAFSPDGERIAFITDRDGNFDIWVMDKDGGSPKNLTKNNALDTKPVFSPDGKEIAFTSTRSGLLQIWIMSRDGSNPRQITDGKSECQGAAWAGLKVEIKTE